MSTRACMTVLIAISMVMLLLPRSVACNGLSLQDSPPKQAASSQQPGIDNTMPGGESKPGVASHQAPGPIDPRTEQVKRTVRRIGLASKISVFLKNGDDLHGAVAALDQDKFQVAEIDLHQLITVEYKDVKKVRSGYGGINLFTGRRTSQPRWVVPVITAALMGMLIVPLFFLRD